MDKAGFRSKDEKSFIDGRLWHSQAANHFNVNELLTDLVREEDSKTKKSDLVEERKEK